MNDRMALNLIAEIMGWDEDKDGTATREYAWLSLMSAVKYDGYADFRAGVRFLETLAAWLMQFASADRAVAYAFVKQRLVYVSPPELQCLINAFVPEVVTPDLRRAVAERLQCEPYEVWSSKRGVELFNEALRRTLFVGLSDGSRIDVLRRANSKRLSTEQVVPMMNIDPEKWCDLGDKLTEEHGPGAEFDRVYLIDDFTASGTTFIREKDGRWKGKLKKFNDIVQSSRKELGDRFPLARGYTLCVHHYISSHQAAKALRDRLRTAEVEWADRSYGSHAATEGLLLPETLKMTPAHDADVLGLCERYYDHALFERLRKHCEEAEQSNMKFGYADCALPVVMDHNTPNNSVPLLWAETAGDRGAHPVRPLFRRRDRHG